MKSDLGIIIDISKKNSLSFLDKKINIFSKYLGKIDVIDVNKITKSKKNIICNNNKINLLRPNNINELKKILSKKNYVLYYCIGTTFKYFKVNHLLSRAKIKKFVISDLGYNPENFNYYKRNFYQKIKIFINIRAEYYVKRILILMNIYPKIDFFFESSQYIIDAINKGVSKKILKYFSFLNFSYYKKVIKINSKHVTNEKNLITNDYIVLIDSLGLEHQDFILREGKPTKQIVDSYYNKLNLLLKKLENTYKKKVIICLHPKNNFSLRRKDYKNFKCAKFQTEKYINRAFLVLFFESSSIIQAVYLKKKILSLQGSIMGDYLNARAKLYSKSLGLSVFNIDSLNLQTFVDNKKSFIRNLELSIKNYNQYINKNILVNKYFLGAEQVLIYLKKHVNLQIPLNGSDLKNKKNC
jgi:hypothetical protein